MRCLMIAAIAALVLSAGCSSNSLTLVVDGQKYVQALPETVQFPIVIEEIPIEKAEAEAQEAVEARRKAEEAAVEAEKKAEEAAADVEKKLLMIGRSRAFRVTEAAENGKIKGGSLALGTFWFW